MVGNRCYGRFEVKELRYLFLWRGSITSYPDLCLDETYESDPKYWEKLGPFKSDEEASGSWILLGRKTGLLSEKDFFFINLVGIKSLTIK